MRQRDEGEGMESAHHIIAMCHTARSSDVFGASLSPWHLAATCPLKRLGDQKSLSSTGAPGGAGGVCV